MFRNGRKSKSSLYRMRGLYKEYDFSTQSVIDLEIAFRYRERDGFNEVIEEIWGNFNVNSSNLTIEVFSSIKFKSQDIIIDQEGNEYKVVDVRVEPDTNPLTSHKKKRSFRKQIIFAE